MPSDRSESDEMPTNMDGFKTSLARYNFNIDRLAKKYSALPESNVEIDLRTFDMTGTEGEVKKEFKKLSEIGQKFSFATMSSPVVNAAELESPQLAAKCLVLNDIFKHTHRGALGLPAPPTRQALTAPPGGRVESPLTRSRSRVMIEEPSSSGRGGDGTPMRPIEGRGTRKSGGGGSAVVTARGGRAMEVSSGGVRRSAMMMIEGDDPSASGIVVRERTTMGEMMEEEEGERQTEMPPPSNGRMRETKTTMDDDVLSGFGGKRAATNPAQRTPPNIMMIEEPVSSRTRQRTRLSLTTPPAAMTAPSVPPAILPPPTAADTSGRRLTMPVGKEKKEKGGGKKGEEKGGRKSIQRGKKEEEERKERKRSADDPPKELPKKQPRIVRSLDPPSRELTDLACKQSALVQVKNEPMGSDGGEPNDGGRGEGKKSDSSILLVGHVYRDATTGRELVVEPESKDAKNDRIDNWLEDSFNRTMSDYNSQDESAGPSTSSTSTTWQGDFEKDKDVESFEKNYRRLSSSARARNSHIKMGMVSHGNQRRSTASQGPPSRNE
ncbi:hypothetical protein PMAYCL1PPCAC_24241 [Pristionchus mayeri]|uniref:Uncharacterized protein n=1 Tax=Pristionchus mayeri TaxID=1317129 RepID=A0AAN5I8C0_9BILA|nr:hypothetical protein PMAYCL1PPCAC_24241 [Pristionchus mayeri]